MGGAVSIDLAYPNPGAVSPPPASFPAVQTNDATPVTTRVQIIALIIENTFMSLPQLISHQADHHGLYPVRRTPIKIKSILKHHSAMSTQR